MDLPNPGIELGSPELQMDSLPADLPGKPPGHATSLQKDLRIVLCITPQIKAKGLDSGQIENLSHTTLLFELLASPIVEVSWLFLENNSAMLFSRVPQISTWLVSLLT